MSGRDILCKLIPDSYTRSTEQFVQAMAHDHDPEVMKVTSSGVGLEQISADTVQETPSVTFWVQTYLGHHAQCMASGHDGSLVNGVCASGVHGHKGMTPLMIGRQLTCLC